MLIGDAPAIPCAVEPGELLLLTPVHVHGARTVAEDTTRVSIDIRIAPREAAASRNPYTFIAPRCFR
jgi:ectoine hydroxylase-related dioxygenase (phytanoyl-CoA dioxygenase family)